MKNQGTSALHQNRGRVIHEQRIAQAPSGAAVHTDQPDGELGIRADATVGAATAEASQPAPLPLSPLQRTTLYDKRNVAQFLTFTEAIRLMLAAKDLHSALKHDPHLRLDEISPYLQSLPLFGLLQHLESLDIEIAQLHRDAMQILRSGPRPQAPGSRMVPSAETARAIPDTVSLGMRVAERYIKFQRTRSAMRALRDDEANMDTVIRAKRQERAECQAELHAFEPELESVVVHFASERVRGPRTGTPRNLDEIARALAEGETLQGVLRGGESDSDAAIETALLREFLSLPPRLMPNARKVAWLNLPGGAESFDAFVRFSFSFYQPLEPERFAAYGRRVCEITGSSCLDRTDKQDALTRRGEMVVFDHSVSLGNFPVAALLLLGIHESAADPAVKAFLLDPIFRAWRGPDGCIDFVVEMLGRHQHRAPVWIDDVLGRLQRMKASLTATDSPA